jgi:hypothetical protein
MSDLDGLGIRPKNTKFGLFRLENRHLLLFSAVADIAKKMLMQSLTSLKNFNRHRQQR